MDTPRNIPKVPPMLCSNFGLIKFFAMVNFLKNAKDKSFLGLKSLSKLYRYNLRRWPPEHPTVLEHALPSMSSCFLLLVTSIIYWCLASSLTTLICVSYTWIMKLAEGDTLYLIVGEDGELDGELFATGKSPLTSFTGKLMHIWYYWTVLSKVDLKIHNF